MVYSMVWPGGITWYMVWLGGHRMVYGMAWRGMSRYVEKHSITLCFKALPWAIVLFKRGVADVSWRSCSHVLDRFTSRGPFTCMSVNTVTYYSCSFWAGIVNREIMNL